MMKIILPLTAILCSLSILYSSIIDEGKRNIEVILHLDDDMTEEEQEVYLWSFCSWISGSEQAFWDSAKIEKGQKTVRLHGFVPYGNTLRLAFSKEGPQSLYIHALPNDTVELALTAKDRNTLWKNAIKGKYHNICTDFEKKARSYWVKIGEASEDSISYYNRLLKEFYIRNIYNNPHQELAKMSCAMIKMFFKDSLTVDSLQALREYIALKFPNYPAAALTYENAPVQSERTQYTGRRLNEIDIKREKYERTKQSTQIGSKLSLKLPSITEEEISLSDLKSKFIFVDIWASWCKPCRAQIPYIKEVLKKYPNDIKIYAVSIDIGHNTWRNAIEKDQTQEFIHVIGTDQDRRNVRSVEVLGIERIPRNFLLDRNCRIIAKDLHDEQLMQTLDSLTKQ